MSEQIELVPRQMIKLRAGVEVNTNRLKIAEEDEIRVISHEMASDGVFLTFVRSYLAGTREHTGVAFFRRNVKTGNYTFHRQAYERT